MTQDSDTGHFYRTPSRKSYNPFDSDDDTLGSPGLKSENVYTKEDCIGFDLNAFEKSADALTFDMGNGDLFWEEALLGLPAVNATANGHTVLFEKNGKLYTDKNVTYPEFINCKSMYQSVKDIGIDEGLPTHDKIWVQSSEDESKDPSGFLAISSNNNGAMNFGKDMNESPKSKLGGHWQKDATLCPIEIPCVDGSNQDVLSIPHLVHEFRDDDSLKITGLKLDLEARASSLAGTDSNKDASKQGEPDFMGKDGAGHDDTVEKKGNNISLDKGDNVVQEPTTGETPSKLQTDHGEHKAKLDKSPNEEETSPESSERVAEQESAYNSDSNKITHNSNLESGSITLDLNSSTNPDPGKQEDDLQNVQVTKPPTIQTMTKHEGTSSSSVVATLEPRVHGETSFSSGIPVPLPSSITFSGPAAYSGSMSLRSESSAGSTRSFAFPILQTEWNSSPVRMAKADQRHLRKHRGWVQALVCCRF